MQPLIMKADAIRRKPLASGGPGLDMYGMRDAVAKAGLVDGNGPQQDFARKPVIWSWLS